LLLLAVAQVAIMLAAAVVVVDLEQVLIFQLHYKLIQLLLVVEEQQL
jgi:hypothetical protein